MMINNELLLLSKNDIPFIEAQVNVHQPTISEISLIGEEKFWSGCQFLNFSKSMLDLEDKQDLENTSDFEVFMSIMCSSEKLEYKNNAKMILTLLFPEYQFKYTQQEILMIGTTGMTRINQENFDAFKEILVSIFILSDISGSAAGYNPADRRAAKIAEKLQKGKNRVNKAKGIDKPSKVAILSRYISILAVGEHKSINDFMQYSVFQLKDEFERYQKKQAYDMYIQAKMAGATDLDDVDNWMDDIHS